MSRKLRGSEYLRGAGERREARERVLSKEICCCGHLSHLTGLGRGMGHLARLSHVCPLYVINGTLMILITREIEKVSVYFFHIN